jgi:hypothetical protein
MAIISGMLRSMRRSRASKGALEAVPHAWLACSLLAAALAGPSAAAPPTAPRPPSDLLPGEIKVWVRLQDKGPASDRLPRDTRRYEDMALHEPYLAALRAEGFLCDTRLKWQNLVSGRIPRHRVADLESLPFVAAVSELPRKAAAPPRALPAPWLPNFLRKTATADSLGAFGPVADHLELRPLFAWLAERNQRPGQGVRIAVMDADFHLGHAAFDRLRAEGRIRDQWDFVDGKAQAVTSLLADSHGADCLSLIAGDAPGSLVGGAPAADFLLYRTENAAVEAYVEEDYLAAAIERAVDSGAHVITTSVVYRTLFDDEPDIPLDEMDGRTRPSSLAALGAARRNVLVVAAIGNLDGQEAGPSTLSVPGDADSTLAVGIVDAQRGHCGYSTMGPTADGRIKPELVSVGPSGNCAVPVASSRTRDGITAYPGTSFAAPAVAAVAALLRQAKPQAPAQEIRADMLRTATHASAPDNRVGWGVVRAWSAFLYPDVSVREPRIRRPGAFVGAAHDAAGRRVPTDARAPAAGIRFHRTVPGRGEAPEPASVTPGVGDR